MNNKFPVPAGYTFYKNENLEGGFDATSYKNGNIIVIAFAPTNTKEWCDIFTDVVLGFGGADKQLMQAVEYYMYIKSLPENEGAEIIFTGHSLGGGLAAGQTVDRERILGERRNSNKWHNPYRQKPQAFTKRSYAAFPLSFGVAAYVQRIYRLDNKYNSWRWRRCHKRCSA